MHRTAKAISAPLIGVALVIGGAVAAGAQVAPDGNASPDAPVSSVFTVNNTLVTLITGLLIPLVVGVLARPTNPAWVKLGLAVGVTGVANLFLQAVQSDGTAVLSQEFWVQAAILLATALGSYARIWQPLLRGRVNALGGNGVIPVEDHGPTPPNV